MTASSPWTLGMIETRKSIVLPGMPQLEAAVLRHALLGDVELRHDLDARNDRAMEPLVDRPHRRLQHAIDPVLHVHGVVLRFDVDVAGAALDGAIDCGVYQANHRARIGGELLDRERLIASLVFPQDLELKALGRIFEHPL